MTNEMTAVTVRYRVKPGRGPENAELVRAVYDELAELKPAGFQYVTFVADDGVSFTHVALTQAGTEAPLPGLAAFQAFREGLGERCEQAPESTPLAPVGSYGL